MNPTTLTVAGPFTHENLSLFLLRGSDSLDGTRYLPLADAMEQRVVTVHETGNVGQLEVENLSDIFDLYIQAGDVVKGGRQDRTLGVDFVLPPKSGRVPIPSFCVESGRWARRESESAAAFSSSKSSLASKKIRLAAMMKMDQGEVWDSIQEAQHCMSMSLGKSLHSAKSPTSYQLSMEDEDLQKRKNEFRNTLENIPGDQTDVIGYAFAVNGEINTADVYGSSVLFRKLWSKLLDVAVLEAIAGSQQKRTAETGPLTVDSIRDWLGESNNGHTTHRREVPPRVRVDTRRSDRSTIFDTCDHAYADTILHTSLITH